MASAAIILARVAPGAAVETALYATRATERALAAQIVVCNRDATPGLFRISISPGGANTDPKDYLYFDSTVAAKSTVIVDLNVTLVPLDAIRVYASSALMTFNLIGSQT